MSFYEEIYYNLPESEREIFFKSLPRNEKEKLLFIINRNNALQNVDDDKKEYFKNIYNNIPDNDKNSFLYMFNSIRKSKRNDFLKIFENINNSKIDYSYSISKENIKNIVPHRENDLNSIMDNINDNKSEFYRIIYIMVSSKVIEILNSFGYINISSQANDFFGKYDYNFDDYYKTRELNSKFLEVLFNIPEDKKEYFFNQFESRDELRDVAFIKLLRNMLNTDKEAFLEIFRNNVETIDLNKRTYSSFAWLNTESGIGFIFPNNNDLDGTILHSGIFKNNKEIENCFISKSGINSEIKTFLSNGCSGLRLLVLFGGQIVPIISILYSQLENVERFVLNRILDIIIKIEINNVLDRLKYINNIENIKDFLSLSKLVNIYQMNNYINLFNYQKQNSDSLELDEDIIIEYLSKCKAKLAEISWIIENFNDSDKEQYKNKCKEIESILDAGIKDAKKFNKVIDYINNIYKTVYYKNNNKSSINYIMEDDSNVKLIDNIKEN